MGKILSVFIDESGDVGFIKNSGLQGLFSSFQALFVFSSKIQIVHFIPLSFNLWGIVQFVIY